jgi:hypothetical protein
MDIQEKWEDIQMISFTVDYSGFYYFCISHSGLCEWTESDPDGQWLWVRKEDGRIHK